uniref:Histone H4 n=1 Tax=Angiostrongylus cantonensis TaxID=6313 RepID=A0A0K0D8M3_ANGCA
MFGHAKENKTLCKAAAKRHRRVVRSYIRRIIKQGIRRLVRRGGAVFLENVIWDAMTCCVQAKKKTVTAVDV